MRITIETDTHTLTGGSTHVTAPAGLLLHSSADVDAGAGDMADLGSDPSAAAMPGQNASNAGGPPDWLLQAVGATKAQSAEIVRSDEGGPEMADAAGPGVDAGAGPA